MKRIGKVAASALAGKRIRLPVANALSFINNPGMFVNQTFLLSKAYRYCYNNLRCCGGQGSAEE